MRILTCCGALALVIVAGGSDLDSRIVAPPAFTVRDSAGIEIVESDAPLWRSAQQAWRVDSTPLLDIGVTSGAEAYELANVRGVVRVRDGRIVVGEFAANLKYFDAAGKHLTTLVRRGQGPGEGDLISGLLPYRGDSILMMTGRVGSAAGGFEGANVLDANGTHGRLVRIAWPRKMPVPPGARWSTSDEVGLQGILADGSFVVRGSSLIELRGSPGRRIGNATFYHVSADGARAAEIATLGVSEVDELPSEQAGYRLPLFRVSAPLAAVHDRFMYWGDGSRFEISVYDLSRRGDGGAPVARTIRAARPPVPAGARERQRYIDRAVTVPRPASSPPNAAAEHRTRLEGLPVNATLPAFRALLVDALGNLWVEHYRLSAPSRSIPPDPTDVPRWTVFDLSGVMLGDVVTPRALQITSIEADRITGIWTDDDGVQHVRMHRIVKR